MKRALIVVGIVAMIAVVAVVVFRPPAVSVAASPKAASYLVDGVRTLLTGTTAYFGNAAMGDVNGDGVIDTALLFTQQPGGSGTFYYVAVALHAGNGWVGTNAVLLGDRIAPQTTQIRNGTILVNYAVRRPGEPFTTPPSVGTTMRLHIVDGTLVVY